MKKLLLLVLAFVLGTTFISCNKTDLPHQHEVKNAAVSGEQNFENQPEDSMEYEVTRSEEEWLELLSSAEYRILRNKGTEMPYMNEYYNNKKEGVYYCRGCGQPLYSSETKYKSGTGWPSFWKPIKSSAVQEKEDNSFFMTRTEIVCSRCGSHIGHVFDDGPRPTGLRYCMNSAALDFVEMDLSQTDVESLPVKETVASNE